MTHYKYIRGGGVMAKCNCRSYNAQIGEVEEIVLPRPDWLPEGERVNGVPVDACIAQVIKQLWYHGIVTLSSCCGHNGLFGSPSIVLGEHVENYSKVRRLIKKIDDRPFELSQWKRVIV